MKLKFENNNIRIRIRKSELELLQKNAAVRDLVAFPNSTFIYELCISDVEEVTPDLSENTLVIFIPTAIAHNWINTEEVGIYREMQMGNNQTLHIAIEKDFPCKHEPDEDKNDKFSELADINAG